MAGRNITWSETVGVHDEVVGVGAGIPPSLPDTIITSLRDSARNSQYTQPRGPCM